MRIAAALPVLALALAAVPPARAEAVDEALAPRGTVLSTIFPSAEEEVFRVAGTAGSVLRIDLRPLGRTGFKPSLRCVLPDGTLVVPPAKPSGKVKARLRFPVDGEAVLTVGSATGGPGDCRLKAKLRPRAPGAGIDLLDLRSTLDPSLLRGPYGAFLVVPALEFAFPAISGEVEFDGAGGLRGSFSSVDPAALPLPGLPAAPTAEGSGSYATDGAVATLVLQVAEGSPLAGDFTVAAGGDVLVAGVGEASPELLGVLLRHEVPTAESLAGSWGWVDAKGDAAGGTLETGSLSLTASGGVTGLGVRTSFAPGPDGLPVPGDAVPLFRSGTFAVSADGTVTVTTRENIFGPVATWTFRAVFGQDVLAGGEGTTEARALLRQRTGLGNADVSGDYLHLGATVGAGAALRAGVLAFDGAGGFSGTEAGVPFSGAYSVGSSGIATFTPSGEATRTGVVGPEARYLLAFGFGDGGVMLELLLSID